MVQTITDTAITLPAFDEVIKVLTLQAGFNSAIVVLGTGCLGVAAGLVGSFSMLRKRALLSDALAHCALPGICAAFLLIYALGGAPRTLSLLLLGALISGVLGVVTVQALVRHTRLSEDAAIGAVLSVFFGAGIVLLSVIQNLGTGSEGGLQGFIYGQTAALNSLDSILMFSAAVFALSASVLLLKEFRLICFDTEFAAAQGWPVSFIDFIMMGLVVMVTVIGLQAVGMILVVAFLIIPPAAARFWTERLPVMVGLSAAIGGASGYLGAAASALLPRLPAGAVIVLTGGVFFFGSFLFAPARGVLAALLRRAGLQLRVNTDHLLRGMFEAAEKGAIDERRIPGTSAALAAAPQKTPAHSHTPSKAVSLAVLVLKGLVRRGGQGLVLTESGMLHARRLTRNHRLWEEYVLNYGHLAASHVDYSADMVEHVLSADLVAELEAALSEKGRALTPDVPQSVHPIPPAPRPAVREGGES